MGLAWGKKASAVDNTGKFGDAWGVETPAELARLYNRIMTILREQPMDGPSEVARLLLGQAGVDRLIANKTLR
jgi:hypothetical protein